MRWIQKTGVKLFRLSFRLTDPVKKVKFFDWIPQSENSVEKTRVDKALFRQCKKARFGLVKNRLYKKWP